MDADNLRVDAVSAVPRNVDWSSLPHLDHAPRDAPLSWNSYEAVTCETCNDVLVLETASGGELHCDVDPDAVLPPCTIGHHHGDIGPCTDCDDSTGDEGIGICSCVDKPCEGHIPSSEGPMMNTFYPCPMRNVTDAAKKIVHLPLCVIEFSDGDTGFALTGGGMDLSWEICAAYVACGYLPPTYFGLPKMGGITLTGWHKEVYDAMRESLSCQIHWAQNHLLDLDELKQWIEDKNAPKQTTAKNP